MLTLQESDKKSKTLGIRIGAGLDRFLTCFNKVLDIYNFSCNGKGKSTITDLVIYPLERIAKNKQKTEFFTLLANFYNFKNAEGRELDGKETRLLMEKVFELFLDYKE